MTDLPGPVAALDQRGPATDPRAPYARLAVVGLIERRPEGVGGLEGPQWLLLRKPGAEGPWDPPGGRAETGEGLKTAILREVLEETGLTVRVAGPCYAYLTFHKGERTIAISMACRVEGDPDAIRLEQDQAVEWRWFDTPGWKRLAGEGMSSWAPDDVSKVTSLASALWEVSGEWLRSK
ncbi:MAG: NUDIX hydrolase [Actinobacteria bacterium]|nr:NUDIX hydrolase [Actinomycetota bacterium]